MSENTSSGENENLSKQEIYKRIKESLNDDMQKISDSERENTNTYTVVALEESESDVKTKEEKPENLKSERAKPEKEKNSAKLLSAVKKANEKTFPDKKDNKTLPDDDGEDDEYSEEKSISLPKFDFLTAGIILSAFISALVLVYCIGLFSYSGKYLPNTYMNGIDISKMTKEQAEEAVLSQAGNNQITIIDKDGKSVVFEGDDYGSRVALPLDAFDGADGEDHALWFNKLFETTAYNTVIENTYSEDSVIKMIKDYPWGSEPATNAEIVSNPDGTFTVNPENMGNMVKKDKLASYTLECLRNGQTTIDMSQADCYELPTVYASDLQPTADTYNTIGGVTVTFDMTNREEILDPAGTETIDYKTIAGWVDVIDNKLVIDRGQAVDWVQTHIADKYDTYVAGYTRKFETTLDGVVDVPLSPTSIYGWQTDVASTAQRLLNCIENRESATIEPVYLQEGFRMRSDAEGYNYTGKTYVEVSLTHQTLWYYVDGELFLETPCVTGMKNDPSRATNPGVFYVWNKQSPAVLGRMEVEGYEAPVTFWMPIDNIGIGLHDLYHYSYGGNVYEYEGSHGCVNLPYNAVQQIYNQMVIGTPVIITP